MLIARKVALRVNGVRAANARVRRVQKGLELVIADPRLGEFVADDTFTLELLEVLHPHEIRRNLPNGGWRRESFATDIDCAVNEWRDRRGPGGVKLMSISKASPCFYGCRFAGATESLPASYFEDF